MSNSQLVAVVIFAATLYGFIIGLWLHRARSKKWLQHRYDSDGRHRGICCEACHKSKMWLDDYPKRTCEPYELMEI